MWNKGLVEESENRNKGSVRKMGENVCYGCGKIETGFPVWFSNERFWWCEDCTPLEEWQILDIEDEDDEGNLVID